MSGPGDHAFVRWAKRYISVRDARLVLDAYKKAGLITVDNRSGTFRILNFDAASRDALEAAAENLRPENSRKWNRLSDEERERLVASKRSAPEQWERQERVELAIAKLDADRREKG